MTRVQWVNLSFENEEMRLPAIVSGSFCAHRMPCDFGEAMSAAEFSWGVSHIATGKSVGRGFSLAEARGLLSAISVVALDGEEDEIGMRRAEEIQARWLDENPDAEARYSSVMFEAHLRRWGGA